MRSVEDQLTRVSAAAVAPRPVRVAISEAHGLLCAEDVVAAHSLPAFDQAAVDGYAVRSVDVGTAGRLVPAGRAGAVEHESARDDFDDHDEVAELTLPVVGEVAAGSRQPIRLQPRQAVRVETGAPMPILADAVLPLEHTDRGRSRVTILSPVRSGEYVRHAGDDVAPGDIAVRAGTIIGAAQVGLLAAVGQSKVLVHPRPRVAVISVGGELVDLDREPSVGQVYDVNSYALAAAARDAGADVHRVGIVDMDPKRLREVVEGQLLRSEVVVIAGGVGGGMSEQIRDALADLGELDVTRVAMYPGSAQGFGLLGPDEVPTFLLPANPVSALVIFEVLIRPLIRIALGRRQPMRRIVRARTVAPIKSVAGRQGYARGQLMRDSATGEYLVQALNGTSLLAALADANCLVLVEPDVTDVRTGDEIDVAFLAQRG